MSVRTMTRRTNPILARMEALMREGDIEAVELDTPHMVRGLSSFNKGVLPPVLPPTQALQQPDVPARSISPEQSEHLDSKPKADCSRRWLGHPTDVDEELLRSHAEDMDASGQPIDISLRFLFLQAVPRVFSEGAGRNLVSLDLSSNNLRSLHGLTNLPRLLELKVYGCELNCLEGLEAPRLAKLDVSDNKLETPALEFLRKIRSVEVLTIDKNLLESLDGVGVLRLKELYASQNIICDLGTSLHRLASLETLHIDDNRLGPTIDAMAFRDLENLSELSVKGNLLRDVNFLEIEKLPGELGFVSQGQRHEGRNVWVLSPTLPSLQHFYAQQNEILRITLPPLTNILEVNLEDNLIETVTNEFVASFPRVEAIYLARNRIDDSSGWHKLANMENLVELSILDNPWTNDLTEVSNRTSVLQMLPHLQVVDDHVLESRNKEKVVDPLMHCKGSNLRCFTETSLAAWRAQLLKTLGAIDSQIAKTVQDSEQELHNMAKYLEHCDTVMKREHELRAATELASENLMAPNFVQDDGDWSLSVCNTYHPMKTHAAPTKSNKVRSRIDSAKAFDPIPEEVVDKRESPKCIPAREEESDDDVHPPLIADEALSEGGFAYLSDDGESNNIPTPPPETIAQESEPMPLPEPSVAAPTEETKVSRRTAVTHLDPTPLRTDLRAHSRAKRAIAEDEGVPA
eukprot:GEMP01016809.1.p1 GENE.GEMP01016809.1~~GEMP01016809.1.p1  ORF type:complete len:687 (+),score=172.43 GEMP01016809.1:119-2179(+)